MSDRHYYIRVETADGVDFRKVDRFAEIPKKHRKPKTELQRELEIFPFKADPLFPPVKLWPFSVPNRYDLVCGMESIRLEHYMEEIHSNPDLRKKRFTMNMAPVLQDFQEEYKCFTSATDRRISHTDRKRFCDIYYRWKLKKEDLYYKNNRSKRPWLNPIAIYIRNEPYHMPYLTCICFGKYIRCTCFARFPQYSYDKISQYVLESNTKNLKCLDKRTYFDIAFRYDNDFILELDRLLHEFRTHISTFENFIKIMPLSIRQYYDRPLQRCREYYQRLQIMKDFNYEIDQYYVFETVSNSVMPVSIKYFKNPGIPLPELREQVEKFRKLPKRLKFERC